MIAGKKASVRFLNGRKEQLLGSCPRPPMLGQGAKMI